MKNKDTLTRQYLSQDSIFADAFNYSLSYRHTTLALLGIEAQAAVHYAMPVRAMLYDALNYTDQVEAERKRHLTAKDIRPGMLRGLCTVCSGTRIRLILQLSPDSEDYHTALHGTAADRDALYHKYSIF